MHHDLCNAVGVIKVNSKVSPKQNPLSFWGRFSHDLLQSSLVLLQETARILFEPDTALQTLMLCLCVPLRPQSFRMLLPGWAHHFYDTWARYAYKPLLCYAMLYYAYSSLPQSFRMLFFRFTLALLQETRPAPQRSPTPLAARRNVRSTWNHDK